MVSFSIAEPAKAGDPVGMTSIVFLLPCDGAQNSQGVVFLCLTLKAATLTIFEPHLLMISCTPLFL